MVVWIPKNWIPKNWIPRIINSLRSYIMIKHLKECFIRYPTLLSRLKTLGWTSFFQPAFRCLDIHTLFLVFDILQNRSFVWTCGNKCYLSLSDISVKQSYWWIMFICLYLCSILMLQSKFLSSVFRVTLFMSFMFIFFYRTLSLPMT